MEWVTDLETIGELHGIMATDRHSIIPSATVDMECLITAMEVIYQIIMETVWLFRAVITTIPFMESAQAEAATPTI